MPQYICSIMELHGIKTSELYIPLTQERRIRIPWRLEGVGKLTTPPELDYDFADHGNLEFCLRLSSPEEYAEDIVGEQVFRSTFPHLFIKQPHRRHRYKVRGARNAVFFIYPSSAEEVFKAHGMNLDDASVEFELTPGLREMLEEFNSLFERSQEPGSAERFDLLCFRILENIFLQDASGDKNSDDENRIRAAASYLQFHLNLPLKIDGLCERFGMSRRNMFRYWKKIYGMPPAAYFFELKMREAARLLSTRHFRIKETASMLGFENTAYFIQAFRRRYGTTPARYRTMHINRNV